jgi:oligopeptide transport system substrate-binding protein
MHPLSTTIIAASAVVGLALTIGAGGAPGALAQELAEQQVLHRGNGAEPETLDVHKSTGVPESHLQRDLFEGLVMEDAAGEHYPAAAESWEVSDDGTVYTFQLREDATWSNGDRVTAEDFVYSFRRGVDPETASEYAFILWPILNAEEISKGEKPVEELGVAAVDERTLEITLKSATPYFIGLLTHHMAYPVHRATVEEHGDQWTRPGNMVNNGPYVLKEWTPQSRIILEKNENFREADQVTIEQVYYYPIEDYATELKRYRAGEIDVTYDVPVDQVEWIEENLAEEFHNTPYLGVYYYAINLTREPFKDNKKLRQALTLALDREILTEKVTKAGELPAYSWIPPGVDNYEPQTVAWAEMSQAERTAEAKRLYEEAGFSEADAPQIEILYNTDENHKKLAIAIGAMWKQNLGVQTTLRNEEWKVYLDTRNQKDFDVARSGWIGDYNDANTFLDLFTSDAGPINTPGYANPEYDRLIRQAAQTLDPAERAELLQEAERLFLDDVPAVPIYHYTTQHVVKPYVIGWEDNIMDVHPTRYLKIAQH